MAGLIGYDKQQLISEVENSVKIQEIQKEWEKNGMEEGHMPAETILARTGNTVIQASQPVRH